MPNCNRNQQERMARPCDSTEQRERMARPCDSTYDLNNLPLGMAYVPWQYFHTVYEVDKALNCGTIFPELNKPFYGKRGVRG